MLSSFGFLASICAPLYRLADDGNEFFTTYDEVYESFDKMGLQENLLRGIHADGNLHSFLIMWPFYCHDPN